MARKSLNVDLNLAPFIDCFSMLTVLLIMSAVWNHIYTFSSNTSNVTGSEKANDSLNQTQLGVTILVDQLEMSENEKIFKLPHLKGRLDLNRMAEILLTWKKKYPNKKDIILSTDNRVAYYQLIEVFDTLIGNDWPDIGVNTQ